MERSAGEFSTPDRRKKPSADRGRRERLHQMKREREREKICCRSGRGECCKKCRKAEVIRIGEEEEEDRERESKNLQHKMKKEEEEEGSAEASACYRYG